MKLVSVQRRQKVLPTIQQDYLHFILLQWKYESQSEWCLFYHIALPLWPLQRKFALELSTSAAALILSKNKKGVKGDTFKNTVIFITYCFFFSLLESPTKFTTYLNHLPKTYIYLILSSFFENSFKSYVFLNGINKQAFSFLTPFPRHFGNWLVFPG